MVMKKYDKFSPTNFRRKSSIRSEKLHFIDPHFVEVSQARLGVWWQEGSRRQSLLFNIIIIFYYYILQNKKKNKKKHLFDTKI